VCWCDNDFSKEVREWRRAERYANSPSYLPKVEFVWGRGGGGVRISITGSGPPQPHRQGPEIREEVDWDGRGSPRK